jgi:hypothetical protein
MRVKESKMRRNKITRNNRFMAALEKEAAKKPLLRDALKSERDTHKDTRSNRS